MGEKFFFWFMDWILDRLDEASTWRAIIIILGLLGIGIKPEAQDLIIQAGVLFFGGAHFLPDKLHTFDRFKSDVAAPDTAIDSSSNRELTTEERVHRFSKSMDRSNQFLDKVPTGIATESKSGETGQKSTTGNIDSSGSGWNG